MKNNKKQGYTFRKFINDVHLWLGVGSALVLFLVCLSGTIYTFRTEIEHWIEPEKYEIAIISHQKNSYLEIIQKTEATTKGKVTRLSFYDDQNKPYELQVSKGKEDKRGETYYVNPYKNSILGTGKGPATEFFMFFFKMHRWLLFDSEIGRPIVGIATLIFVILTITGLFLWFPKKIKKFKSLKPGLKIKFKANWKRINHDLHNTLGFYACMIILIMALTGLNWSFEWYKNGLSSVLGAEVFGGRNEKKLESNPGQNLIPLNIESIIEIGNKTFIYPGKTSISFAKGKEGSVEFRKQNSTNFNKDASDRIIIDQYSGAILKKEIFADKAFGAKIAAQIKAIHLGEIYGTFSKIIYFITCLIATSLPVTGIFIWINKMKKKSKST
ncbi:PepSY-associated TM helix domain-containing protein [Flavobacterium sp. SM2513]|uniref:PepSY-associated TM helix domain-containing protein n=1 Tax=Flavobacterium sp. SM2513 TaxID=3424766 RepID=UPI003D7F4B69